MPLFFKFIDINIYKLYILVYFNIVYEIEVYFMKEYKRIFQEFQPIYNENSKILLLGSFPSEKSRQEGFYYGNKRNRFWKLLSILLHTDMPESIEEKIMLLLNNNIALWDVIDSCDIRGSSDSSIKNVSVADIKGLIDNTNIKYIYTNGNTAKKLYDKYVLKDTDIEAVLMPSTSPANAAFGLERLISYWKSILEHI